MLTKTSFMSGWQCPLRAWFESHRPHLATPLDAAVLDRLQQGREVGELARLRYPGGVLVVERSGAIEDRGGETRRLMADPDVPAIFEGVFVDDAAAVQVDVLRRVDGSAWDLLEVKSSSRVKDEHLPDVGVQALVLRRVGVPVRRVGVLHLDRNYVLDQGGLDVDALFVLEDLTDSVGGILGEVAAKVDELLDVLAHEDPPDVSPGPRCRKPYTCPFTAQCHPEPGKYDVSQLPRAGKMVEELAAVGIDDLRDLPRGVHLSAMQARVRDSVVADQEYVGPGLRRALEAVEWPLLYLDFETTVEAIPRHVGTGPWWQLSTQWSLHVQERDGSLDHCEFIHDEDSDPRRSFAESLLDALEGGGSIVVYSSFEKTVLRKLAADLPDLADQIEGVVSRLHDLLAVIRDGFYHPAFRGSFSIKAVLPALVCPASTTSPHRVLPAGIHRRSRIGSRACLCDHALRRGTGDLPPFAGPPRPIVPARQSCPANPGAGPQVGSLATVARLLLFARGVPADPTRGRAAPRCEDPRQDHAHLPSHRSFPAGFARSPYRPSWQLIWSTRGVEARSRSCASEARREGRLRSLCRRRSGGPRSLHLGGGVGRGSRCGRW